MLTKTLYHKEYKPKSQDSSKGFYITVAGNVGAGKSTFTRVIGEAMDFDTSYEKVAGNPYLEDFYEDQKKWGFHLQLYFLSQRFQDQKKIGLAGNNHIQDRSIYEDVEIFARALYEDGKMNKRDYDTYSELFYAMMSPYLVRPDLMVFLDGSVDTIIERIDKRGREMERKVPRAYWESLHRRYQNWILNYKESPVLTINIDRLDLLNNGKDKDLIVSSIQSLIKKSKI